MTEKNQDIQFEFQNENQNENQIENANIGCRLFLEQIELLSKMPIDEAKEFLWALIMSAYCRYKNQNENQFENQNENQIECAYVSVSVSVYVSVYKSVINSIKKLSEFNKLIFNSMEKTVRFKQFSSNYGGIRKGAGRKKKVQAEIKNMSVIPTQKDVLDYVHSLAKKIDVASFISYYNASNWRDKDGLPINWKQKALTWANKYQEPETDMLEKQNKIIARQREQAIKEGRI